MGLEQRCIKCLYFSCLLNIGLTQLKNHSGSLHYMGEFSYRNALSFIKGNQSCGVPSQNFPSILKREVNDQNISTLDYTCLLFLDDDLSEDRNTLRISDVNVEIHEYDIQYRFRLNPFDCTLEKDFQNVNLFLTCFQRKDNVAKTCQNGKGCDDDLELCHHYSNFQKSICIPKRKYNESCGMHSQCYKNTICTQTERRKFLCLCKEGFEFINGDCLKVNIALGKECVDSRQCIGGDTTTECVYNINSTRHVCSCNKAFIKSHGKCLQKRRLYEPCDSSLQCKGTHGATECRYLEGVKLCYCPDGYDIIESICLRVGLAIGESCYLKEQCTGSQNTHQCQRFNESGILICQCNTGFIRHGDQCLQASRTLYEDCILDDQCNGTSGASVCRKVRDKGFCECASNYIEDKNTLRCRKAKKSILESCKIDEQCTGTENAGVCRYDEQMERYGCACNDGYINWHKEKCIKSDRLLFESCEYDIQCNGTEAADVCSIFGEMKICYCKRGSLEFQGRCIEGEKKNNDSCEIDLQCSGTKHAGVCGENSTCKCEPGFLAVNGLQDCIQGNLSLGQSCVESSQCTGTENSGRCVYGQCFCDLGFHLNKLQCIPGNKHLYLLVGAGVLLFVITASFILCIIACRRKLKARGGRLVVHTADNVPEDHNYYTYAIHGNIRDTMESQVPLSPNDCSYTAQDTLYDTTHHAEKQTTENLYDVSEPLSTFRDQTSSEGVYMYNHLHDKETQLCENLYDVTEFPVSPKTDA